MDARNPDYDASSKTNDEISLADLVVGVWRSRGWAVLGALGGLSVAGAAIMYQYLSAPGIANFRQDIALTLDAGQYPNGTDFSTSDLRSPIVLQRVHEDLDLETFDLTLREFAASISVTPASQTYDAVIARYRQRLADNGLSYSERQQIETEFSTALSSALATGARIEFTVPTGHQIPRDLGRSVVTALPNVWADVYINQLGVLNLPIPGTSAQLVNTDFLAGLDYPMAHDALAASLSVLSDRISSAMRIPGAQNLRAEATGRTLFDIDRDVGLIERYSLDHVLAPLTELGLNKSPDVTAAAYRYQIEDLSRRIELAAENALVIDAALATRSSGLTPTSSDVRTAAIDGDVFVAPSAPVQGSVVQQFGPELVERLVLMSVENASVDFRESLIDSKLGYERSALQLSADRARLEQRLALISGEAEIANRDVLADIFTTESEKVASDLNDAWSDVESILARANVDRISQDSQLFRFLPTDNSASISNPLIDRRSIILAMAAAIGGLMLGLLSHVAVTAVRGRAT